MLFRVFQTIVYYRYYTCIYIKSTSHAQLNGFRIVQQTTCPIYRFSLFAPEKIKYNFQLDMLLLLGWLLVYKSENLLLFDIHRDLYVSLYWGNEATTLCVQLRWYRQYSVAQYDYIGSYNIASAFSFSPLHHQDANE